MLEHLKLINHPVRMRICQALHRARLSTTQLHAILKDVPKPSLYRHLRILLKNNLIQVVDRRQVNGIEEKIYSIDEAALEIRPQEIKSKADLSVLAEFASIYISAARDEFLSHLAQNDSADLSTYIFHDFAFYATDEEFSQLKHTLWQILADLETRAPAERRTRRRLLIVAHPSQAPTLSSPNFKREEASDETA